MPGGCGRRKDRRFFPEEKAAKRLSFGVEPGLARYSPAAIAKVFWFFLSKKNPSFRHA
jgi:hypothetical protein